MRLVTAESERQNQKKEKILKRPTFASYPSLFVNAARRRDENVNGVRLPSGHHMQSNQQSIKGMLALGFGGVPFNFPRASYRSEQGALMPAERPPAARRQRGADLENRIFLCCAQGHGM